MTQNRENAPNIVVWVDAVPKTAQGYLSTRKRYGAEHIGNGAYKITADDNRETIINPLCDKHHLAGCAWNVEVGLKS